MSKRPHATLKRFGFPRSTGVTSFSASAKVEALDSFVNMVTSGGRFFIAGASLGGAAAIEVAAANENCQGLVLLDAVSRPRHYRSNVSETVRF